MKKICLIHTSESILLQIVVEYDICFTINPLESQKSTACIRNLLWFINDYNCFFQMTFKTLTHDWSNDVGVGAKNDAWGFADDRLKSHGEGPTE